jgi:hypothetical protein
MTELEQIGFEFMFPKTDTTFHSSRPLDHIGFVVRWMRSCVVAYSEEWHRLDARELVWLMDARMIMDLPPLDFKREAKKEDVK